MPTTKDSKPKIVRNNCPKKVEKLWKRPVTVDRLLRRTLGTDLHQVVIVGIDKDGHLYTGWSAGHPLEIVGILEHAKTEVMKRYD